MNIHRIINQMILNERDADQVGVLPSTTTKPKKPKTPSKEEGEFNPPPSLSLGDIESGRGNVALKAGLKNIEDEVAAGTLDRKTANDYKQQLMDRFGAGVKELEQLEKEKAVETGLDTAANIAGMIPGPIGTAIDVAQTGSLLARAKMANTPEEKAEYEKQAAITAAMGILAPPLVGAAFKGAGKVAKTVAPKTTEKIADVAAKISKGGEKGSVPGQIAGGAGAFLASTAAGAGLATSLGAGLAGTYVGKMAGEILAKKFPGLVKDIGKGPKFIPGVPSSTVSKPSDKPEAPKPSAAVSKPSDKPEASKSFEEVPSGVPLAPSKQPKFTIKVPKEKPTAFYDVDFNTKPGAVSKPSDKPEASKSSVSSIGSKLAKMALSASLAGQSVGALPTSVTPTKVSAPVTTVQKAIQDVMNIAMTPIGAPKATKTVTVPKATETVTAPKAPLSTGTVQKTIQDVINPSRAVSTPSDAPAKAKDEAPAKAEAPAPSTAKAKDEAPAKAEAPAPSTAKAKDEAPPPPKKTKKIRTSPVIPPVIPVGSPEKPKQPELTSVVANPFGIKVRSNLAKFGDDDRSSIGGRSGNDALIGYYNKLLTGGGR